MFLKSDKTFYILFASNKNAWYRKKMVAILLVLFLVAFLSVSAQTASIIPGISETYFRSLQLKGQINLKNSLTIRSTTIALNGLDTLPEFSETSGYYKLGSGKLQLLPLNVTQVYNSNHPYGWNDGSMIPSRGNSIKISGGFSASIGKFSIQLYPEYVVAQNTNFETFSTENYDTTWSRYYRWLNRSDIPEKFGNSIYKKVFPGQSSIRYNSGSISVGISTENNWWGPGTRNALVMSNNAPGFLHATFNTTKPILTKFGSLEWQIIAGKLSNSEILPPEINRRYSTGSSFLYQPKNEDARYLTGMIFSWQPKWVKGLFVGFAKTSVMYSSDITGIADIFPLEGIIKSPSEKKGRKYSLGSLFARYVMPEDKTELYVEFGRNDKSPNFLNLVSDDTYPRAYVAGIRKLFTSRKNSFIEFSSEFTQMQLPDANLIKDAQSWYTHDYVRQGYTNMGQVLGAGIGPGSNSQMISIAWIKGIKKIGLLFERFVHNNDFYYNAFADSRDFRRHWTDLSTTLTVDWKYKRFLLSTQMGLIRSLNYEYWYFDYLPQTTPSNYFKNGYDVMNFHANISFSYRL